MPPETFSPFLIAVNSGRALQLEDCLFRLLDMCLASKDTQQAKWVIEEIADKLVSFGIASEVLENPNNLQMWLTHRQTLRQALGDK